MKHAHRIRYYRELPFWERALDTTPDWFWAAVIIVTVGVTLCQTL